jgi:RNA polymerase sigma factor (sigma-70 family)
MEPAPAAIQRQIRALATAHFSLERTDHELLQDFAAARDEMAFAALVGRHGPLVFNVCRHVLRHEQDAEDAFQATFLVLARKAASIHKKETVGGWLHGVAYRTAMSARRAMTRQRKRDQRGEGRTPEGPVAEASLHELQALLDAEVERLPYNYRAAFVLCCLEGRSKAEAARELGWEEGTVSSRLAQARERLRKRLVRHGVTFSAALTAGALVDDATAAVPATLTAATVRGVLTVGALPAHAEAWAEGVLSTMSTVQWKAGAALVLTLSVLAAGAFGYRQWASGEPQEQRSEAVDTKPVAQDRQQKTDRYGDPLPPRAVARLGTLRFRHWAAVSDAAYSPDGKLLATAGTVDRQVRLWEATTGRLLASVPGKGTVVFTHNGQRLFYCGGNINAEAKFLNIARLREEGSSIFAVNSKCLALSPDGRCLALDIWSDKPPHEVMVCDANTGKERYRLTDHQKQVSCVAYSPDGKTIATAGDEAVIRLWDAATGILLLRLDGHKPVEGFSSHMLAVTFSPDGKQLVSGGMDKTVRLWDVANGKEMRRFGAHKGGVLCVAFTLDGKQVLTGGFDEPIRLWDAATGKEALQFPMRSESAARIAFAPGGKSMAVVHWGIQAPRFWDLAGGREVPLARGPESEVTSIVFSRDGRTLTSAGHDGVIRHWNTDTGRELRRWENVPDLLNCLASSPDGQIVAGGDAYGTICLWTADTGRELRRLKEPKGWLHHLAFAPDGKTLASAGNDGSVRLWHSATGAELRRFTGHERSARSVAFTPDGKTLATTADDQTVRLWRVDTGEELRRLKTIDFQNNAVAISPDGRLVVVASGGERPIQVWEFATSRELPPFTLPRYQQRIFSLAFSLDGRTLATGGEDGVVRLWEVASAQERRRLIGHTGWAFSVRFAPDGKRLASASNDTTTVVWDLETPSADEHKLAVGLTEEQAKALWAELAGDAERVDRAIRVLGAAPVLAVPLLDHRLTAIPQVDPEHVQKLIAQLDNDQFAERERAAKELAALDELALPALRAAAMESTSLEQRRRIDALLKRSSIVTSPEMLRSLRAIEVLERIGNSEAREVLLNLAKGAAEARLTREAKATLERLNRRNAEK